MPIPVKPPSEQPGTVGYYANLLDEFAALHHYPDTYQGNMQAYVGMTWGTFYVTLANAHPNINRKTLADGVLGLIAAEGLGTNISHGEQRLSQLLTDAGPAALAGLGSIGKHIPNIPGVGTIDDLINWFKTNAESFFLRAGEVTVGVILVYVGVKAMTSPAGQQVGTRTFKQTVKAGRQFATGHRYKAYKTVKASRG